MYVRKLTAELNDPEAPRNRYRSHTVPGNRCDVLDVRIADKLAHKQLPIYTNRTQRKKL